MLLKPVLAKQFKNCWWCLLAFHFQTVLWKQEISSGGSSSTVVVAGSIYQKLKDTIRLPCTVYPEIQRYLHKIPGGDWKNKTKLPNKFMALKKIIRWFNKGVHQCICEIPLVIWLDISATVAYNSPNANQPTHLISISLHCPLNTEHTKWVGEANRK